MIICELNRSVQAFLVGSVNRIVNLNWEELSEPPVGIGFEHFITAITQLGEALSQLQLDVTVVKNGERALDMLEQWVATGVNMHEEVLMVITDAEMPQMDGYRLTTRIRDNPALKDLYIVLHTSLSGSFNSALVEQVACDEFLA